MTFRSREPFIELGTQPKGQADYVEQDGIVYAWSESNIHYEPILERASGKRLVPDVLFERIIARSGAVPDTGSPYVRVTK